MASQYLQKYFAMLKNNPQCNQSCNTSQKKKKKGKKGNSSKILTILKTT